MNIPHFKFTKEQQAKADALNAARPLPLAWPKPAEPKPATRIDFADDCEEFGIEHEAETQWSPDDPSDCDLQQCINCGVIYYDG